MVVRKKPDGHLSGKNISRSHFFNEDNVRHLEAVLKYGFDPETFTIYIGGDLVFDPIKEYMSTEEFAKEDGEPELDEEMAGRFAYGLQYLSRIDPKRPILVVSTSSGGNYYAGLRVYGSILLCPNPVTVLATKTAASAASFFPLPGDRLVIQPQAHVSIHRGQNKLDGIEHEIETAFVEMMKEYRRMVRIYAARLKEQGAYSHLPENKIKEIIREKMTAKIDVHFDADEAQRAGIVDHVQKIGDDLQSIRATTVNSARRKRMYEALSNPISVKIIVKD